MTPKFTKPCLVAGIAAVVLIATVAASAQASEGVEPTETEAPQTAESGEAQPALQSGRVVHVDPATGKKTLPTPAQRAAAGAQLQSMMSRSSAGLIETASPRSGVMVNLQGRFRHATTITLDANGDAQAACSTELPAESPAAPEEAAHE